MTNTYNGGYMKALLDVVTWFEERSELCAYYKLNRKHYEKILSLMLSSHDKLMNESFDIVIVTDKNNPKKIKELKLKEGK